MTGRKFFETAGLRVLAYSLNTVDPQELQDVLKTLKLQGITDVIKIDKGPVAQATTLARVKTQSLPPYSMVFVSDDPLKIEEAIREGCWTIAMIGANQDNANNSAKKEFLMIGTHFMIKSLDKLPDIVRTINTCLQQGERPANSVAPLVSFTW